MPDDLPQDVRGPSSEGEANAELAPALRHAFGEYAIDANGGKRQREGPEDAHENPHDADEAIESATSLSSVDSSFTATSGSSLRTISRSGAV